jgi:hypothetical protein
VIESLPRPGDIGLTSVRGPVGRLIQLGEALCGDGFTQFEHAFLVLPGGMLIEAQPGGAVIRPLSDYDGRHVAYVAPAGMTDGQREAVCAAALKYVGVGYSFLDYAAIAAHRVHLPVPFLKRLVASSKHMLCSQLVDQSFQDGGCALFSDLRWPGYVVPADLWLSMGGEQR